MSEESKYILEVQKRWEAIGKIKQPADLEFKYEFYKKIFDIFQIGKSYFFIFSPPINKIEMVSPTIMEVLGYDASEFTINFMLSNIHPDDLPTFVDFENSVVDFKMKLSPEQLMKYKSQYNYRIRNKEGKYIQILQQSLTIQCDEDGAVLRNLAIHTDISDFKTDNKMKLSFIGLEGEPSYHDVDVPRTLSLENSLLTPREKEILQLLVRDKSSVEIAELLSISPETVKTHRKNIHSKIGTTNTLQLVFVALEKGWI